MKKITLKTILFSVVLLFIVYKFVSYFILDSQITFDNKKPKLKLSQFVNISEKRIKYSKCFYINKNFIGFNAFVDNKHFITVTKMGKASKGYKIIKTDKKPNNSTSINLFNPSNVEDENSRYIDLHEYPFAIKQIYYHSDGQIININQSRFYEVEAFFTFFNISFKGENRKDFGYAGFKKKKSISFIEYKNELYLLSVCPIKNREFKSLHKLIYSEGTK